MSDALPDLQSPVSPSTPPGAKKGLALASLILGFVSLCLGILTGVPAVICGIMGFSRASRQPHLYTGKGMAVGGIVLGFVGILFWVIAVAAYPSLMKRTESLGKIKDQAQVKNCAVKLQNLSLAARIYAVDHRGTFPKSFLEIKDDISSPKNLFCPADTQHRPVENWNEFKPSESSYEFLTPGAAEADIAKKPVFRCKTHGQYVVGDGTIIESEQR